MSVDMVMGAIFLQDLGSSGISILKICNLLKMSHSSVKAYIGNIEGSLEEARVVIYNPTRRVLIPGKTILGMTFHMEGRKTFINGKEYDRNNFEPADIGIPCTPEIADYYLIENYIFARADDAEIRERPFVKISYDDLPQKAAEMTLSTEARIAANRLN